jgi:hypothetical protein
MKKKPFTDTEVLRTKSSSTPRTSELADGDLGQLRAKGEKQEEKQEQEEKQDQTTPSQSTLLQRATKGEPLEDREGLQRAYDQGDSFKRGDTLYVAGSHTKTDWYDNFTKMPFWGDLRQSHRYKEADKMLDANRDQVHNVVGHSLGGSIAHELQKNHPGLRTVTYGSPAISWGSGGERYRNNYDPFSALDRGATRETHPNPMAYKSLTHDYHNFTNVTSKDGSLGHENPDKSVSITE